MALPYLIGLLTTANTGMIDANFNAIGDITPIPCSAAGSNTIALTPATNTPTVNPYNQAQTFVAIAASSNTGATTAAVGALAALNVYKDTGSGPVALTGSEIIANNAFFLTYDAALDSGAGGFHLNTGPVGGSGSYLPLAGGTLTGNIAAPSITIPSVTGSSVTRIRSASASLTWGSLAPGATSLAALTITGVSIGDVVGLGYPASIVQGIAYTAYVSSASVVTVEAFNFTPASSLTPTGGFYRASAMGFT
jgi:hypothetical protein